MKSKKIAPSRISGPSHVLIKAFLVGLAALDRQALAQSVLAPTPETPDQTPPAVQQTSEMDVFANNAPQTEAEPFRWKDLTLRPHPFYQFLYADGLRYGTNQTQIANSLVQTISPGVLLQVGNHWTLDYSPVFTLYSKQFSDAFGQTAKLAFGTAYNDWIFNLSQSYIETDSPSSITGTQVRSETFATILEGLYTINSKLSADMSLNQNFVSADQFSSYKEWSTIDWLNYQIQTRLYLAFGTGLGYDLEPVGSPDMTFQQFQGKVGWRATDKLSFQVHGGVEIRQFLNGGSTLFNPIFDATIQYQPFQQTKISVTGQQVVSATYLQNQVTETTGFTADLNQRFLGKVFLDVNGGYQTVKYVSSEGGPANRTDNLFFINTSLSHPFLKRGTFALIYQISRDDSTFEGFSYTSHQVGFQIGFAY